MFEMPNPRGDSPAKSARAASLVVTVLAAAAGVLVGNLPAAAGLVLERPSRGHIAVLVATSALAALFGTLAAAVSGALHERAAAGELARATRSLVGAAPAAKSVAAANIGSLLPAAEPARPQPAIVVAAAGATGAALVQLALVRPAAAAVAALALVLSGLVVWGASRAGARADRDVVSHLAAALSAASTGLTDPGFAVAAVSAAERAAATAPGSAVARAGRILLAAGIGVAAVALLLLTGPAEPATKDVAVVLAAVPVLVVAGALAGRLLAPAGAGTRGITAGTRRPPAAPLSGAVSLRRVALHDGETPVIADLTLEIAAGERVGLLVPNQRASTALAGLLAWLVPPDGGAVLHDGHDPDSVDPVDVWNSVRAVSARAPIVPGSILDNLVPGGPRPEPRDIDDAVARSGLADVLDARAATLDTPVTRHSVAPRRAGAARRGPDVAGRPRRRDPARRRRLALRPHVRRAGRGPDHDRRDHLRGGAVPRGPGARRRGAAGDDVPAADCVTGRLTARRADTYSGPPRRTKEQD